MKFRSRTQSSPTAKKLGIQIEDAEYEAITGATDENGKVELADVYDIPVPDSSGKQKTIVKVMEKNGIEYTEHQYQKEYQLRAAHQLMINGGSTAQIAQALSISLNAARDLKRELAARQLNEIKNFNAQQEIAKAYMFYDHIASKALQLANKGGEKALRTQVEALKVALQAQSDKQKFLALAGAYEQGLRTGDASDKHVSDANETRDMLDAVLTGGTYEVIEEEDYVDDGIEILS